MRILLNGETREVAGEMSIAELLRSFELSEKRVAVELNLEVVPRADWPTKTVAADDRVEVIHFVGGG